MSTGFGLVLSPAPPTPVLKDHGFVTVNGMICNKEFFCREEFVASTVALRTRCC